MKKVYLRGFSLVELILAISVLGLGILVVLGIFPKIIDLNLSKDNTVKTIQLAQDKMDELLAAGTRITGTFSDQPAAIPSCRRTWAGQDIPGYPNLQQVTVTVEWPERGKQRNFSITSMMYVP